MTAVFLFGYVGPWRGFALMGPGGRRERHPLLEPWRVDGGYAPRRLLRSPSTIVWREQGVDPRQRNRIEHDSEECPQGECLLHQGVHGFTVLAWWDRTQGDSRPGCSTTLFVEGEHDASAMLSELAAHFPGVLSNLRAAGVELREVRR